MFQTAGERRTGYRLTSLQLTFGGTVGVSVEAVYVDAGYVPLLIFFTISITFNRLHLENRLVRGVLTRSNPVTLCRPGLYICALAGHDPHFDAPDEYR